MPLVSRRRIEINAFYRHRIEHFVDYRLHRYKLTGELYIHYQTSGFLSTADGSITRSQAVARIDDRTASQ